MKNFLTSLIFSINFLSVQAQQERFIYLQMESKQPFFIRMNDKVYNSYAAGYLVIPKLDDGIYTLTLGFPRSNTEHQFNCTLKNKDVGYIIKSEEGIWQLLNVQTADFTVAMEVSAKPVIAYERATDPFSRMLANAVNDSTILRKDVAVDNLLEKLQTKDTAVVINSTVAVSDNALVADSSNRDVAIATPEKIRDTTQSDTAALITRNDIAISDLEKNNAIIDSAKKDIAKESLTDKITELNQKDSVVSVIPNEVVISNPDVSKDSAVVTMKNDIATTKPSKKKKSKKDNIAVPDSSLVKNDVVKETITEKINGKDTSTSIQQGDEAVLLKSVIKRRSRKNNRDGLEMMYVDTYGDTKDTIMVLIPPDKKKKPEEVKITDPVVIVAVVPKEVEKDKADYKITREEKEIIKEAKKDLSKSTMINSDCKYFAEEGDFLKVRKKMVAEDNDQDMIKAARKIFKSRCFTTEQIKNLSVLFLKDEGKFMFFEAAYPFVSDSDLYYTLENQLTDVSYLARFKAMINK